MGAGRDTSQLSQVKPQQHSTAQRHDPPNVAIMGKSVTTHRDRHTQTTVNGDAHRGSLSLQFTATPHYETNYIVSGNTNGINKEIQSLDKTKFSTCVVRQVLS